MPPGNSNDRRGLASVPAAITLTGARHCTFENCTIRNIGTFGRLQQLSRSRVEPHHSVFLENNIVYWKKGVLLDNKWRDKPYTFYFHPKNESGTRQVTSTFEMDWNMYYNPTLKINEVEFNGLNFEQWRKTGKDVHSLYADPLFVDPEKYDFRLKSDSPAFALGFKPIDLSNVGPRDTAEPSNIETAGYSKDKRTD